jgi:hypothetical protein
VVKVVSEPLDNVDVIVTGGASVEELSAGALVSALVSSTALTVGADELGSDSETDSELVTDSGGGVVEAVSVADALDEVALGSIEAEVELLSDVVVAALGSIEAEVETLSDVVVVAASAEVVVASVAEVVVASVAEVVVASAAEVVVASVAEVVVCPSVDGCAVVWSVAVVAVGAAEPEVDSLLLGATEPEVDSILLGAAEPEVDSILLGATEPEVLLGGTPPEPVGGGGGWPLGSTT